MAITKDQLISDIAEAIDTPKSTVRAALEHLSEIVSDALENGDEITLPGIGKLKVSERPQSYFIMSRQDRYSDLFSLGSLRPFSRRFTVNAARCLNLVTPYIKHNYCSV